ncbi:hypothetical protein ACJ41O_014764 [Fusarium nematophilum]
MRFNLAYALALLASSNSLITAVPVDAAPDATVEVVKRGQIPGPMDTTACKQYSTFLGEWTYEARVRTMDNTADVCKRLKDEIGKTIGCTWRHSEDCRGNINDPRVAKWKFKTGTNCGSGAVSGIIRRATGQSGSAANCLISFNGDWPPGTT